MRTLIETGLAQLGLAPQSPPSAPAQLERFGGLLLEKNRVMNLTAITDPADVATLHMLDCAALLTCGAFAGKTLIDVGTGAGFPGVPLKILEPTLSVTLLDALGKRVDWLNETAAALELKDIAAVHGRAEEAGRDSALRERFDFATARAVAELRVLCELCLPFVKVGGRFLAMKSTGSDQELAEADHAVKVRGGRVTEIHDYLIPGTDVTHRLIVMEKTAPSPEVYPRRWAKIPKKPL